MGVETSARAAEPAGRPQRFWNGIAWTEVPTSGVPGIVTQRPPSEPVTGEFPRPSAGVTAPTPARTAVRPDPPVAFGAAPHPTRGRDRLPCHRAHRDGRRRAALALSVVLAVVLALTLALALVLQVTTGTALPGGA